MRISSPSSLIFTPAFIEGLTGHSRHAGITSNPTAGSARSASQHWRTRSSTVRLVEVLNAIYEEDFLGFSYGFRPGRGPHDALDALAVGIGNTRVNWVLDADIAGFLEGTA